MGDLRHISSKSHSYIHTKGLKLISMLYFIRPVERYSYFPGSDMIWMLRSKLANQYRERSFWICMQWAVLCLVFIVQRADTAGSKKQRSGVFTAQRAKSTILSITMRTTTNYPVQYAVESAEKQGNKQQCQSLSRQLAWMPCTTWPQQLTITFHGHSAPFKF